MLTTFAVLAYFVLRVLLPLAVLLAVGEVFARRARRAGGVM